MGDPARRGHKCISDLLDQPKLESVIGYLDSGLILKHVHASRALKPDPRACRSLDPVTAV